MQHPEASKIALYGVADYCWNMDAYDSEKNWEAAIKDLLPGNATALRTFALYNKALHQNGHNFYREEGQELVEIAEAALKGDAKAINDLKKKSTELKTAVDILLADKTNPRLNRELMPWLLMGRLMADYGQTVCSMASAKNCGCMNGFDALYKQAISIYEQMRKLATTSETRHFLQKDIYIGEKVYLPTLQQLFINSVNAFNKANGTNYDATVDQTVTEEAVQFGA